VAARSILLFDTRITVFKAATDTATAYQIPLDGISIMVEAIPNKVIWFSGATI